jgi:hypothetical protein
MWYNLGAKFIFFLTGSNRAINNSNSSKIFKTPWTPREEKNWRENKFGTSNVKQLAPELITYWKDT